MDGIKKRSANFTEKEETILTRLVKKYRDKLECRKTDKHTNRIKMMAWMQVCNEFNSSSEDGYRDYKILRNKFENMKKRWKKEKLDAMKHTDDGYRVKDVAEIQSQYDLDSKLITEELDIIEDKLGEVEFVEYVDESVSQGEMEYVEFVDESVSQGELEFSEIVDEPVSLGAHDLHTSSKTFKNWDKLSTPKSTSALKEKKRTQENCTNCGKDKSNIPLKIVEWARNKADAVALDMQFKREEHELRLQLMRERHAHELKILDRESQEKIKLMKHAMIL